MLMRKEKPKHKHNKKELKPLYTRIEQEERQRKETYRSFFEKLSDAMQMTGDVLAGQAMVSLGGNHTVMISNYHAILEYSPNKIRISTYQAPVTILGTELCIQYLYQDEIKIIGNIDSVTYQN